MKTVRFEVDETFTSEFYLCKCKGDESCGIDHSGEYVSAEQRCRAALALKGE